MTDDNNTKTNDSALNDKLKACFEKMGLKYDEKMLDSLSDKEKQELLNQFRDAENTSRLLHDLDNDDDIDDTEDSEDIDPSDLYDINLQHPTTDPDVIKLRSLPPAERLYYFLDDIVPKKDNDSSVIVTNSDPNERNGFEFTIIPKSIEIFEQIANMPNHAALMYPNMVKYFDDILWLYQNEYYARHNPYWSFTPIGSIPILATPNFMAAYAGTRKAFISIEPKKNSIPYRLCYGDNRHQNDFVGIVYLYFI